MDASPQQILTKAKLMGPWNLPGMVVKTQQGKTQLLIAAVAAVVALVVKINAAGFVASDLIGLALTVVMILVSVFNVECVVGGTAENPGCSTWAWILVIFPIVMPVLSMLSTKKKNNNDDNNN
jgi:hypothetical protein